MDNEISDRYVVPMTKGQIGVIKQLLHDLKIHETLDLNKDINELKINIEAISYFGCFKHMCMQTLFISKKEVSKHKYICPECNPEDYKQYKEDDLWTSESPNRCGLTFSPYDNIWYDFSKSQ